jgi:hypothetical protein
LTLQTFAPKAVQLGRGHRRHIGAVDPQLALGGPVEAADQVDQRAFAGA